MSAAAGRAGRGEAFVYPTARRREGSEWVRLASNESPFPPPPGVVDAITRAALQVNRYPDPHAETLRAALAARLGVEERQIAFGNGTDELIALIMQIVLRPGDEVVMPWPSFPSFVKATELARGSVVRVPTRDGAVDVEELLSRATERTRVIALPTPNNPTGTVITRREALAVVDNAPPDAICLLDEAYVEFVDDPAAVDGVALGRSLGFARPLVVLRTFSKSFGLAGLRLGYSVAGVEFSETLNRSRPIFNTSAVAQAAALAALRCEDEMAPRIEEVKRSRRTIESWLRGHGIATTVSQANFAYGTVIGTRFSSGAEFADALERHKVIVRDLDGYGAPGAVRITVGTTGELAALKAALDEVLPWDQPLVNPARRRP